MQWQRGRLSCASCRWPSSAVCVGVGEGGGGRLGLPGGILALTLWRVSRREQRRGWHRGCVPRQQSLEGRQWP
eukprot:4524430-Pyramimonas_sp.AAC.1